VAAVLFLMVLARVASAQDIFEGSTENVPPEVERMYVKGLQFLTQAQSADGSFTDPQYGKYPAVVGLAVLSMLAHGDDPNSGPYSVPIKRGLNYILSQQNATTGYIGEGSGATMYNHGFATLALAEAYGVVNDERLGPALEKAVKMILESQAQNPLGAWRYSPQAKDADTTVSGAQMVALLAARNAGIGIPQEAIDKGLTYYKQMQSGDGGVGYTGPGASNMPRTAIGALVFILSKQKDTPQCKAMMDFLKKSTLNETQYYFYYLYYAAQANFQASQEGWNEWNRLNINTLRGMQKTDGSWDGSQGTTFSTAAGLLSLALNYRYLPIYER
jgi:hypothetical protein